MIWRLLCAILRALVLGAPSTTPGLSRLALLFGLGIAAVAGCSSPCEDLADRICQCETTSSLIDACKSSVKNQIGSATQRPGSADQARCSTLLNQCVVPPDAGTTETICDVLKTEQGKMNCGLAVKPSGS